MGTLNDRESLQLGPVGNWSRSEFPAAHGCVDELLHFLPCLLILEAAGLAFHFKRNQLFHSVVWRPAWVIHPLGHYGAFVRTDEFMASPDFAGLSCNYGFCRFLAFRGCMLFYHGYLTTSWVTSKMA